MPTKPPKTLDANESNRLLQNLLTQHGSFGYNHLCVRNHTMARLMLDTGIRVGELVKLRIEDLYFGGGPVHNLIIHAGVAKNGKERIIPISERLCIALNGMHDHYWSKLSPDPQHYAFFCELPTLPLSVRQVERIISSAGMAATGRKITPHTLRHTFATKLMRKTSMRVVQELLGHAQLTSTQIYTHPNQEDLKNAIDSL